MEIAQTSLDQNQDDQAIENLNEMQNSRLGWDIGIGLTISTPLGPVRLDYAVPYINDEMKLRNGKINFGVQYLF